MYLKKYNITSSEQGIKKMIVLIWSKEKQIKEEVMQTYWSLFLNTKVNTYIFHIWTQKILQKRNLNLRQL